MQSMNEFFIQNYTQLRDELQIQVDGCKKLNVSGKFNEVIADYEELIERCNKHITRYKKKMEA